MRRKGEYKYFFCPNYWQCHQERMLLWHTRGKNRTAKMCDKKLALLSSWARYQVFSLVIGIIIIVSETRSHYLQYIIIITFTFESNKCVWAQIYYGSRVKQSEKISSDIKRHFMSTIWLLSAPNKESWALDIVMLASFFMMLYQMKYVCDVILTEQEQSR